MPVKPRQLTPALEVETVGGGHWSLAAQQPEQFTMIVIYRGLHCSICRRYLAELNALIEQFSARGVSVLVASTDSQARAEEARREWRLDKLTVGYGLSVESAREWGLFVSAGRGAEPPLFAEPGAFLVKPDRTLYWASISTMPFARPAFAEILRAVEFVVHHDYPARGEA